MKKSVIIVFIISFMILFITYPFIFTKNIIKNNFIYEIIRAFWLVGIALGSIYLFTLIMANGKIRTKLLCTMLHKAIFSIVNISLFILVFLLPKGTLSWMSENLEFLFAGIGGIPFLFVGPEMRLVKGERLYEILFEYYTFFLVIVSSGVLFALVCLRFFSLIFSYFL